MWYLVQRYCEVEEDAVEKLIMVKDWGYVMSKEEQTSFTGIINVSENRAEMG